jgi:hypothetical protein
MWLTCIIWPCNYLWNRNRSLNNYLFFKGLHLLSCNLAFRVGRRNREINNPENRKTRPGKINNTRHYYDHSTNKPNENNRLWRVRVAPLITAGSGSLTSIYWIPLNTCNYAELPLLQDCHSTQPIITLSQCDKVFNTIKLPWAEVHDRLPNSRRTHQELTKNWLHWRTAN